MADYQNYNNNSRDQRDTNTNTRGKQYYNSEGTHKSTLALAYWNKMVSLKLHPALPADKATPTEKFDYNQVISTALSNEKALKIEELINEVVIPSLNEGSLVAKGVPIGLDSALVVGVNENEQGHYAFLTIAKGIDPGTKIPSEAMTYQFNKNLIIDRYDTTSGEFDIAHDSVLEVKEFAIQLRVAVESLVGAQAHAMRHVDKYYRDRLSEAAGVKKGNGAPYGGGTTGSVFGSSNNRPSDKPDVDRASLDNVETIANFTDMG